jgi:2-polyprenyl-6-hydroxyphenyl methylase/3-demethylubiquinone-9 3-methyltransferase
VSEHAREIAEGKRFAFGENWSRFLSVVTDDHLREAEASLTRMLDGVSLRGKRLLDIGSGSGLFGLAARRQGARVQSFDFDPQSVACTREVRRRYAADDPDWQVGEGSVLDAGFVRSLGEFDVVYSWGVLHHTGAMWQAIDHAQAAVAPDGLLYIALYNDQGRISTLWKRIKQTYCSGPIGRALVLSVFVPYWFLRGLLADVVRLRDPRRRYAEYKRKRGMSVVHDWIDWLGGYPFEVASPEQVLAFLRPRGFELIQLRTTNGLGTNEYVFRRRSAAQP